MAKQKHPLIGKKVEIEWVRGQDDGWHDFKILAVEWPFMKLQGVSHDGAHYGGGPIWVPIRDVFCMEEI